MIEKYIKFIISHPKKIIFAALLLTVLLASGIPKLTFEENIKDMIPKDMPSRRTLNELEEIFGGSDVALIGVSNEEETIFNVRTLKKIRAITDSLDVMPGINRVNSLATIKYMEGHEWGLEVTPYLEEDPETEEDARRIREMFYKDSTYIGIMVSEDGKYASIIAQIREDVDIKSVYQEIKKLTEEFRGPEKIYEAGTPIVQTIISKSIKEDLRRLIPFVIGLIALLLYLSFRSFTGVLLPLAAVIMSAQSMLGLMGHLNITFTAVNNIMPVILLGIGIDYGIHVMANYYQDAAKTESRKKAIIKAIPEIASPMIMACITTMAGFLSLLTSPLDTHHEFGFLLAFGIFMALIYNMTFVPAFLSILPMPKSARKKKTGGLMNPLLNSIGRSVIRFRYMFAALGIVLAVAAAFGISNVNIEMNPISFFPEDSEIVEADNVINTRLGGSVNMNILFEGKIQSYEVLNKMDNLQNFIEEEFPETGSTISLATMVKKINKSLNSNDPAFDILPETDRKVAQAILMYETSGDPADFENIVDASYEYGQVIAMLKSGSTKKITKIANKIENYLKENSSDDITVKTTGFSVFFKDMAYLIISSQVRSISFAVIFVLIIASLTYRSFLLGLFAIIPFCMCVIFNFGIMGFAGIDLSIPMAMFSSMIIGIGVDFSFHLISRFKHELKIKNMKNAVSGAIKKVGEPVLYSAFTTACGGLVLVISGFVPVRYLGLLFALIMTVCAFLALTVLASSLTFYKKSSIAEE